MANLDMQVVTSEQGNFLYTAHYSDSRKDKNSHGNSNKPSRIFPSMKYKVPAAESVGFGPTIDTLHYSLSS